MTENLEHIPNKSQESGDSGLTVEDVSRADFQDFDTVKSNMAGDSSNALTAFDGENNTLEITGQEDFNLEPANTDNLVESGSNPGDLVPGESDQTIDAKSSPFKIGNLGFLPYFPFEQRQSQAGRAESGLINRLDFTDQNSKSSFEFSDDGITSTRITNDTKEVRQYNSNGEAVSAKLYRNGEDVGEDIPITENDYLSVEMVDGNTILNINNEHSNTETQIVLGSDGNVSAKREWGDRQNSETLYNEDGSPKSQAVNTLAETGVLQKRVIETEQGVTTETFNENGAIERRHSTNPHGETVETFNDNGTIGERVRRQGSAVTTESYGEDGEWEKTHHVDAQGETTTSRQEDGSILRVTESNDGSKGFELQKEDGTKYTGHMNHEQSSLVTENPDGTRVTSIESDDKSSHIVAQPDGYWVMYNHNKVSGRTTITHGDKQGTYTDSQTYQDV